MGIKRPTFNKVCTTSGVAERLVLPANEIRTRAFMIQANASNTGYIRVGSSDVSLTNGAYLSAESAYSVSNDVNQDTEAESNLSDVWIVASVSGEGVNVSYEQGDDLDF
jgi:hypothetical protein